MTPKEKADELFAHYNSILIDEISHGGARGYASYKCALTTVDEILEICSLDCLTNLHNHEFEAKFNYWQEVKKEIEKI
jgi:hypothetical protein